MKTFIFTLKEDLNEEKVWKCNAPSEAIAWDMFSLVKNLDKESLKYLFRLKIKE